MLLLILLNLGAIVWNPVLATFDLQGCPEPEDIAPYCICKNLGDGPMMLCSNIMSPEDLIKVVKATDSYPMFSLAIIDSSLMYLPYNLFENTKYEKIRFANSQIMALSDEDIAFKGLEDRLEEIRASGAHYITTWDWNQLRNLRHIRLIDIHMISMYRLEQKFPPLKSLRTLGISKAEISYIHPQAFADLESLIFFSLENNEITEINRAMFPNPAKMLHSITLSCNLLQSLPEDMFTNMPELTELYLDNNKFSTLDEDVFRWPLENLQVISMAGNEFHCDCRLKWMAKTDKPFIFKGNCTLPEDLAGIDLKRLSPQSLWC